MQTPQANNGTSPATATPKSKPRRLWPKLLILILIVGFIAGAIALLPRGYSQDLSLIGKGSNVVVLVHDHNKVASLETMNAMNTLRGDYEGKVNFLVADLFTPRGRKFAETHGIESTALVFFAPNGEKLGVFHGQQDAELLRKNLSKEFHF